MSYIQICQNMLIHLIWKDARTQVYLYLIILTGTYLYEQLR